jgi:phenylacetate-CoA ligase
MRLELGSSNYRLMLIDFARKTNICSDLSELRDTQWWSLGELQELQLGKLQRLAKFAVESVPFYRNYAQKVGFSVDDIRKLGDGKMFPVMTKSQMKKNQIEFLPNTSTGEPTIERRTGGSTGTPFCYKAGVRAISIQWAAIYRAWEWSQYRIGEKMVTLGGGSVSPTGKQSISQLVYNGLKRNVSLPVALLDEIGLKKAIDRLDQIRPSLIYGYPSIIYQIARNMSIEGVATSRVKSVVTTSEMLFPNQRAEIERAFGAPVFDQYGCNEVNLVTCECETHDGYHVAMESTLVEILDEQDNPVPAGTVGRIVATGLANYGMPFLRYDTGDLGALSPGPCSCGRQLERIMKLKGRTRDLIRSSSGSLIHGVAFNEIMLNYSWVDRFQVVQPNIHELILNIDSTVKVSRSEQKKLISEIVALCQLKVTIRLNEPFELTSGLKMRVVVSHLEECS